MLKFLTIVFLTLFTTATVSEEYGTMINKGVLCNPKPLVFKKLDREGWVPAIRMTQDSGFVTYIFFKETYDTIGKVGKARIYEVEPNRQVACFISEGKRIQWNGSFWDTFILKEDGLYI